MLRATAVVAALLLAALPACKGDRQKCETAVRNFATLLYWDVVDKEIAAAPPAERDSLRKRRLAEFPSKLENDVDFYVNQCISANNTEQIDCMTTAKTSADAKKCSDATKTEPAKPEPAKTP